MDPISPLQFSPSIDPLPMPTPMGEALPIGVDAEVDLAEQYETTDPAAACIERAGQNIHKKVMERIQELKLAKELPTDIKTLQEQALAIKRKGCETLNMLHGKYLVHKKHPRALEILNRHVEALLAETSEEISNLAKMSKLEIWGSKIRQLFQTE